MVCLSFHCSLETEPLLLLEPGCGENGCAEKKDGTNQKIRAGRPVTQLINFWHPGELWLHPWMGEGVFTASHFV